MAQYQNGIAPFPHLVRNIERFSISNKPNIPYPQSLTTHHRKHSKKKAILLINKDCSFLLE